MFSLFTEDPIFKEFEEIPGETEERRKARWDREQRTKSRVVCVVIFGFLLKLLVQTLTCKFWFKDDFTLFSAFSKCRHKL